MDGILNPQVDEYLAALISPRDQLLLDLEAQAGRERIPICGPQVGTLLSVLVAGTRPQRVLELGTAIGYSAIWIVRALSPFGGRLRTIELDPSMVTRARENLRRANLSDAVEVVHGAALDVLPSLTEPVEFIFIDAVKEEYPDYFPHVVRLLRPGGVLLADNMLLGGSVASTKIKTGWSASARAGIRKFTDQLFAHPAMRTIILPIRDGLAFAVRSG